MAFYIKSSANTFYYKEDGTQVPALVDGRRYMSDAKSYSTEAAAQAVIDKTDPFHWCFELKEKGRTLSIVLIDQMVVLPIKNYIQQRVKQILLYLL